VGGGILPIILLVVAVLGGWWLLTLFADAQDWMRLQERLAHQRALADMQAELAVHGDVVELPTEAKFGGPAKRSRKAGGSSRGAARAADTQTHDRRPVRTQDRGRT
jgi:hypothetical protein